MRGGGGGGRGQSWRGRGDREGGGGEGGSRVSGHCPCRRTELLDLVQCRGEAVSQGPARGAQEERRGGGGLESWGQALQSGNNIYTQHHRIYSYITEVYRDVLICICSINTVICLCICIRTEDQKGAFWNVLPVCCKYNLLCNHR